MKYKRINWKVVRGKRQLHPLQKFDLIADQKDIDLRFPTRNNKLLQQHQVVTHGRKRDRNGRFVRRLFSPTT